MSFIVNVQLWIFIITTKKWEEEKEILFNFQCMNARGAYWIFKNERDTKKFNLPHTCYGRIFFCFIFSSYLTSNPIFLILLKRKDSFILDSRQVRHDQTIKLFQQVKSKVSLSISFLAIIFFIHNRSKQFFH